MAFTVEDGTGVADANSYASTAEADAYFSLRNDRWDGLSDNDKQRALVIATDFVDDQFGSRFLGVAAFPQQGLQWPRLVPQAQIHYGEVWQGAAWPGDMYGWTEFYASAPAPVSFPTGIVPRPIKRAVYELAVLTIGGADLYASRQPDAIVTQSVDVIGPITKSRSFAVQPLQPSNFTVYADKVSSIIAPLLDNAGMLNLRTGRA